MTALSPRHRVLLLTAAAVLLMFSNGRWILSLATWAAPVLWLRYVELERSRRGVAIGLVVYVAVALLTWRGLVPAPRWIYFAIVTSYACLYFLPLLLHRALVPRLHGVAATLVFPAAWVSIEYLLQTFLTPYGSWFSIAYTQSSNLPLLQLVAFTGTWGIVFLITWVAAVAVRVWAEAGNWRAVQRPVVLAAAVLLFVIGIGELRLRIPRTDAVNPAVRVAALVPDPALRSALNREVSSFLRSRSDMPDTIAALANAAEALTADLLRRTAREAAAGAVLVAWSETAARILHAQEAAFVQRVSALAASARITIVAGYGVYTQGERKPLSNRVIAVGPDGVVAWTFDKAHPIAGAESPMLAPGDGQMRALDTPAGRVTVAICHDFDFPELIRQASGLNATLLIDPAADWYDITAMHANMALLRSIENGIPMLRPTAEGRTLVTDAFGRSLVRHDDASDVTVANIVPMRIPTIYGRTGDVFPWLTLLALVGLVAQSRRTRERVIPTEARATVPSPERVSARVPTFTAVILLLPSALTAQTDAPLERARAALETCIAATNRGDEKASKPAADEADRWYTEAERATGTTPDVLSGRARVLSQCRIRFASVLRQPGLVKRSNELVQRALAADSLHFEARFTLAMNHYYTPRIFGQSENSLREFEWIIARWGDRADMPLIADAYLHLGRLYERHERPADAQRTWRRGVELFPDHAALKKRAGSG